MKFNRILSSLLAVTLIGASMPAVSVNFSEISITANAEETEFPLKYEELADGTIEITGCDDTITEVEIPAEIDGKKVTSIGESAFMECMNLTEITIPDSVTNIGEFAFYDTPWLENKQKDDPFVIVNGILIDGKTCSGDVVIPENVTSIGDRAFFDCSEITSVIIPDSVTRIGNHAFNSCWDLTSITIPDSVTSIGESAFFYCESLTEITIPNGVTSIGRETFGWCLELTSITIPNGVTSIGDWAFADCSSLTSITIPDSVTCIGSMAFVGCSGLTEITIPDSVISIGQGTFRDCSSLTEITIPDSVTRIRDEAFNGTPWLENKQKEDPLVIVNGILIDGKTCSGDVIIPDSVTSINDYAFSGCSSLTAITIPDNVTGINHYAFKNCSSLITVTIPESVTYMGSSAFLGTPWLENKQKEDSLVIVSGILIDGKTCSGEVIIPNGVRIIGGGAFYKCSDMTSVTIPDSVTGISVSAFNSCFSLKSITILNPNCEIYDSDSTISNDYNNGYYFNGTIYGYENSTAQAHAEKYGYKFESLGDAPESKVIAGDANCDGTVSIADATAILQHLGNQDKYGLSAQGLKNADVDGNDGVSTNDALVIQKVDAKLLTVEQLPLKK